MLALAFEEESHTYRVGASVVPSVTQVIAPLTDWSMVPRDVLERKRRFGTAVHQACELDDAGELDEASTHPEVLSRVIAWRQFLAATGARVLAAEGRMRTWHQRLGFAGTPDRLVFVDGEHWLVDIKTAELAYRAWGVQLAGYVLLLEDLLQQLDVPRIDRRCSVQLLEDRDFKVRSFTNPNDELCFRACLSVHQWKVSNQ